MNGSGTPDTVLVMGARRTGTTLLNQILCNDPGANPHVGECQLLTRLCGTYRWANEHYDGVVQWYFDARADHDAYFMRLVGDFLDTAARHFGGVRKLVLKNPEFSSYKTELDRLLPNALFLVCVRDPRDQIASEFDVGSRQIAKDIDGESARAFKARDVESLARKFLRYYRGIRRGRRDNVHYVRYEDLVLDLPNTLRNIEGFTGFDLSGFDPEAAWSRFEHVDEIRKMPAYVAQYGAPLDRSRVGRFRETLSEDEQRRVAEICADFMAEFYPSAPAPGE